MIKYSASLVISNLILLRFVKRLSGYALERLMSPDARKKMEDLTECLSSLWMMDSEWWRDYRPPLQALDD